LIAVSNEVVFRKQDYERMLADVRRLMEDQGTLSVAEARDHFNTSRRYVLLSWNTWMLWDDSEGG